MRLGSLILGSWVGALALAGAACNTDKVCGNGTVKVDDRCVPTEDVCGDGTVYNEVTGQCDGTACAAGTVLIEGECVPDGTVVCGDGTVYDPDRGECVPDQTCGEGTVEIDGECVPYDDAVTADVDENAEPNSFGDDNAGNFTVPEIGEDLTIKGCVNPYEGDGNTCGGGNLLPDFDAYYFVASGPTLLEVSVDGLNGLSGGFLIISTDAQLDADSWSRFGVNPADDIATRQVFLPKAGTYALGITDGRSVLLGESFGGPDSCYLARVRHLAMPTPTLMAGATATGNLGDVQFFRYPSVDEGDLLFPSMSAPSAAARGMLVAQVNNTYRNSGTGEDNLEDGPGVITAGMHAGDSVVFAVDHLFNYSLSPVPFTLRIDDQSAQALPSSGSVNLVNNGDPETFQPNWLYFDVDEAGDMWRNRLSSNDDFLAVMIDPWRGDLLGELDVDSDEGPYFADQWSRLPRADRFYVAVQYNDEAQNPTFSLNSRVDVQTPAPFAVLDSTDAAMSAAGSQWYTLDLTGEDWVTFLGFHDFDDSMEAGFYESDRFGILSQGSEYDLMDFNDSAMHGRITRAAELTSFLVRLTDTGGAGGDDFYFEVGRRDFVDVTIDESTPYSDLDRSLDEGDAFYLITAPERNYDLEITASPDADEDLAAVWLDRFETDIAFADGAGDAGTEYLGAETGRGNFTALVVFNYYAGGSFDLSVDAYLPPYSAVAGTKPFVDACECGANEVLLIIDGIWIDDDDGISDPITLDGDFSYLGGGVTEMSVAADGYVSFDSGYLDPFFADLYQMVVCVKQEAEQVTIQWTGLDGETDRAVQMQAVLHDDDTIDYIYGAGHEVSSAQALIDVEDSDENGLRVISDFQRGFALPSTSYTLTYNGPPPK